MKRQFYSNALIKRGGGKVPYEAQQPSCHVHEMVPNHSRQLALENERMDECYLIITLTPSALSQKVFFMNRIVYIYSTK